MESFGGSGFNVGTAVTRKRSSTTRKPRSSPQPFLEDHGVSPPSSAPSSDNASKQSSESGSYDAGIQRKEFSLNSSTLKISSINRIGGLTSSKRTKKDETSAGEHDGIHGKVSVRSGLSGSSEHGRSRGSEGAASSNWRNVGKVKEMSEILPRSSDNFVNSASSDVHNLGQQSGASNGSAENKLRKVKLKVGGVTHTIHAKSNLEGASDGGPSKHPRSSDASRQRQKIVFQDNSEDGYSPPESGDGLQGGQWNKGSASRVSKEASHASSKQSSKTLGTSSSEPVRKSKRVPKKRVLDGDSDEDEDDEIRYLERLKRLKASVDYVAETELDQREVINDKKNLKTTKTRKVGYEEDDDFDLSRRSKEARKKSRSDRESEDMDYVEEEEHGSDTGPESKGREPLDLTDGRREISLTTRQRALQSGKNGTGGNGTSLIEFPDGLPPAPPRRQKEKLSEVEQQLKKAEAAQRRRLQVEKAARESEAEAIRKILGQDSSRKKREDKLRKKRDELAQERAANSVTLASNMVRWIMGPTGTTVTFSEAAGLPSVLNSNPRSYPPPREKCAGPSCTNAYKYRDSKSNLPLCSLQCYRAVQQGGLQVTTC